MKNEMNMIFKKHNKNNENKIQIIGQKFIEKNKGTFKIIIKNINNNYCINYGINK